MTAILTEGCRSATATTLALDALDLTRRAGRGLRLPRPERRRARPRRSASCSGCTARRAGRAELFGIDAWRDPVAAHRRVAYVAGEPFLWPALTGAETFEFLARLHGGDDARLPRRAGRALPARHATRRSARSRRATGRRCSSSPRSRRRADLLMLDEPTSGLDPLMEMAFRETVLEAKERGQTVFLSSHILSEVEALCDRVGILRDGRLVDEGTLAELRHLGAQTVEVTFDGPAPELPPLPGVHVGAAGPNALRFEVTGSDRPADRRARRVPGRVADEPRAVARGDLPAPLRRAAAVCARLARSRRARARATPASARLVRAACSRVAVVQPVGYRRAYPTPADRDRVRAQLRRQQGGAALLRRAARPAHASAATAPGASAACCRSSRRSGALLAAVRALRAEEDAGRQELVLAGAVGRRDAYLARRSAAIAAGRDRALAGRVRRARVGAAARRADRPTSRSPSCRRSRSSPASARSRASSRRPAASRSRSSSARARGSRSCCA